MREPEEAVEKNPYPYNFRDLYSVNHLNLPRLPIPNLDETLDRYLESLRPHVEPAKLEAHTVSVNKFRTGQGPQLQEELMWCDSHEGYPYSYVQKYWDDMYLELRTPSTLHVNVGYSLRDDNDKQGSRPQSRRLAKFILSSFLWQQKLIKGLAEPELSGKDRTPNCMAPLGRLLGTARVPKPGRDELRFFPESKHVVCIRANQFYRIDVMAEDGSCLLSRSALQKQIQSIIDKPMPNVSTLGIGVLTTEDRDMWSHHRNMLKSHDSNNRQCLFDIDSALLVVCLDHSVPKSWNERSEELLHGSSQNLSNRWFDKFQVVSDPSGTLGVNFEHSYADGLAWNRWLSEVWYDMQDMPNPEGFSALPRLPEVKELPGNKGPRLLKFNVPDLLFNNMRKAQAVAQELVARNHTQMLQFDGFGKQQIKQWKASPDGFVQLVFQLAYYRLHKRLPPTYESCATRLFFHGRTECIRSAHWEGLQMCKALCQDQEPVKPGFTPLTKHQKRDLITKAMHKQLQVSRDSGMGQGVDRHLMALGKVAQGVTPLSGKLCVPNSHDLPSFMQEEPYSASARWLMSTSNVTTPWNVLFNFGPVCDDGYGVGYLVHDESIPVNVTSWHSSKVSDSALMASSIEAAFYMMKDTLDD